MLSEEERNAINAVSGLVIGAAIEVHRTMGPGLLESVYEECLVHELTLRGINAVRQKRWPLTYKQHELHARFRPDLVVNEVLLVEVKAVDKLAPIHDSQLLTYLKLTGLRVGLILNFNEPVLKNGIRRLANGF